MTTNPIHIGAFEAYNTIPALRGCAETLHVQRKMNTRISSSVLYGALEETVYDRACCMVYAQSYGKSLSDVHPCLASIPTSVIPTLPLCSLDISRTQNPIKKLINCRPVTRVILPTTASDEVP